MRHDSMIDAIGHTPLVRLRLPGAGQAYAKLELRNGFSMKDRAARHMIEHARRTGLLAEGAPIVESSSGSLALGLAVVGRGLGHEVHIVTDPRIDPITLAQLTALGCAVHVVPAMTGQGWQSARLERLTELMRQLPGAFWPRQYANPANPAAYARLAAELMDDLDRIDVLIGAVGSGGSLCGTARALRDAGRRVRVVAVDCVGSVLFGQPDRPHRLQSGLGNSLQPPNLDHAVVDEVHWLNDREAFEGSSALAGEQQIFAGNTSGSVYVVTRELARKAPPGTRLVAILPDRGDRYVHTVYDEGYQAHNGLDRMPAARLPARVRYGSEVTSWSYAVLRPPGPEDQLAFVESNTTGTGMAALTAARQMGYTPTLYTADPGRYRGLTTTGAAVRACHTGEIGPVRAALAGQPLAGITTTSDFYAEQVAVLAAEAGLPGNDPGAVARCRNKLRTRQVLQRAGIAQPRFEAVRSVSRLGPALEQAGLPCVVKPADDSGSHLVRLCADAAEAAAHVALVLSATHNVRGQQTSGIALVEQYVAGAEYSVETFSHDGAVTVAGITAKRLGPLPSFVEMGHVFPAALPDRLTQRITRTVTAALDAVGYAWGPAHTEVRVDAAQRVAIIEINARLAGGTIPELVRLATGVDLLRQQLCAAVRRPVHLAPVTARHAGVAFLTAPRAGTLREIRGLADASRIAHVVAVERYAADRAPVRHPASAYDRIGHVIAVAEDAEAVRAALVEAPACIEVVVEPAVEESA
jgi:cysteine synthase/biotin carboxylase